MPDDDARLADGVLVEADVHARVLGLRLLRLDATVVLLPAGTRPAAVPSVPSVPSVAVPSGRPARQAPPPALSDGSAPLLRARRLIAEADELLARSPRFVRADASWDGRSIADEPGFRAGQRPAGCRAPHG